MNQEIKSEEITMDDAAGLACQDTLVEIIRSIFAGANNDMMPVSHAAHHASSSVFIRQRSTDFVHDVRQGRKYRAYLLLIRNHPKRKSLGSALYDVSPKKEVQKRKFWTAEETNALEQGMMIYGVDWVGIRREFAEALVDREPGALKDRARVVRKIKERNGEDLGVWGMASKPKPNY